MIFSLETHKDFAVEESSQFSLDNLSVLKDAEIVHLGDIFYWAGNEEKPLQDILKEMKEAVGSDECDFFLEFYNWDEIFSNYLTGNTTLDDLNEVFYERNYVRLIGQHEIKSIMKECGFTLKSQDIDNTKVMLEYSK